MSSNQRKRYMSYKSRYNLIQKVICKILLRFSQNLLTTSFLFCRQRKEKKQSSESISSDDNRSNSSNPLLLDFDCSSQIGEPISPHPPEWDVSSLTSNNTSDCEDFDDSVTISDESIVEMQMLEPTLYPLCQLTKTTSMKLIQSVRSRHSLTKAATEDILKLIQLHLPPQTSYPTSYSGICKELGTEKTWCTRVFYCAKCNTKLRNFVCNVCQCVYTEKQLI
ncbi:hypothetical protein Fcan01_10178 [Folsomia candida]|uniref:Uncharacterized protein n=1 Tax=Folsomia candida TaxID=158441 RepID=A0A226EBI2_FOLCA|nr:hypothetical protein Fcan01_10178 [Folsomia candida]